MAGRRDQNERANECARIASSTRIREKHESASERICASMLRSDRRTVRYTSQQGLHQTSRSGPPRQPVVHTSTYAGTIIPAAEQIAASLVHKLVYDAYVSDPADRLDVQLSSTTNLNRCCLSE